MNTFDEGDRVTHPSYGEGTVTVPRYGTGWPTVQFDSGEKVMTDDHLLTPVRKPVVSGKIKIGDRVSHRLHPDGTVEEIDLTSGLFTVGLGGSRAYRALEHQITPAKPTQKFNVQIMFARSGGFATGGMNSGPMSKAHAEGYLTQLPDWDNVESITITRAKG